MNGVLLLLAAACIFLPELLPLVAGGSVAAWFYVFSGIEAAALWAIAAALLASHTGHVLTVGRAVCAWASFEALQRPMCRLPFPMDRPPPKPPEGKNLCDVVTGLPMSWVSVVAALFLAALVQEFERARR